jgi:hypothetical protein
MKAKQHYSGAVRFCGVPVLILAFSMMMQLSSEAAIRSVRTEEDKKDQPYTYPLKKTADAAGFLTDTNGKPFFWLGDAAWSLIAQLSREEADFYLDDRSRKGFTVVMVSLIEHKFAAHAPADKYGDLPFTGGLFTTPNEKYFAHADYVIQSAAGKGIVVLLDPIYLGYGCGDEGWCSEVGAASEDDMYKWGSWVGKRYSRFSNIVWLIGGDTDPSPVREKILAVVKGIRETDKIHLFSAHNQPGTMAVSAWAGEDWLSVNNVYNYDSLLYRPLREAYDHKPAMPFFMIESTYENEHNSKPAQLRAQAYQSILCGAMGHIFGNCPVWHFGSAPAWCKANEWHTELNNDGSIGMDFFGRLMRSREWQTLMPDFGNTVIKDGFGSWGKSDYVASALTADKNTYIAYVPSARRLTVDLTAISGSKAVCWWYDPRTGQAFSQGIYSTLKQHSLIPPDNNDWVLVIDNAGKGFPPPGRLQ